MTTLCVIAEEAKSGSKPKCSVEEAIEIIEDLTPMESEGALSVVGLVYPEIDLDFLRMRQPDGFPKFTVFRYGSPICKFYAKSCHHSHPEELFSEGWIFEDSFATHIGETYFADVFELLIREAVRRYRQTSWYCRWDEETRLVAQQKFNGIIPKEVKQEIKHANLLFDGETIIIADAGPWVINETKLSLVDPLVVRVALPTHRAFLISAFDVSSAEEMVAREFTTGTVSPILNEAKK